jgi:hypothetical protein
MGETLTHSIAKHFSMPPLNYKNLRCEILIF